ncbi:MAG: leucine-rich repeat protein, partial [Muribaculaceae bacterium]|nr:leucine-rich repeat protein [Muribaculaceae bacterium]
MRQKYLLTAICLLLAVAAKAYVTTWPLYGEVFVEDIALADDNTTIVNNIGDCYYDYQYCPALHIAALRHIYPSNASGERDFVLVPTYIIVDGVAYHVVGVSGQLLGDDANTIKNIYLHNELEFLGSRALYNATAVSSITIPASVRSIAYDVFNGLGTTSAIRTLTFADGNEPLAIEGAYSNGRMIIANMPLHTLHLGRTFAGNSYGTTSGSTLQQTLVNLTVGGEGTEVSPGTFKEFPNLTNVTFNAGVASIGANAFEKCPKLESVTMSAVARIGDYAFASDSLITSLSLGEGVRYIGDYAFNDCKRVSSLTLPTSLDSVHVRAFVGMVGVQTLTIADTDSPLQLFGIGKYFYGSSAFSHLTALETAYVGRNLLPTPNDTRFSTP